MRDLGTPLEYITVGNILAYFDSKRVVVDQRKEV